MLYQEHGFLDRFDAAAADGFRGVEFVGPYDFSVEDVAAAAQNAGTEVVLFNSPAGDWSAGARGCACQPGSEAVFREGIERAIIYAGALECRRLHVMDGNVPACVSPHEAEDCFVENLRWAAGRLDEAGIVALIEPINGVDMPGYGLSSLAQAERLLAAVRHRNLRLQYDFYHMAMMGEALVDNFERLRDVIGHVQVADRPGRHEPGTGAMDFGAVFDVLKRSGYDDWVGAEYRPANGTRAGLGWLKGL